jgi:hypothetical protein
MKNVKKRNRLEIARKIISNVKREMQKPRLTESVRIEGRGQSARVVEEAEKVFAPPYAVSVAKDHRPG